jgi:Zn-dependent protease
MELIDQLVQSLTVYAIPLVLAITFHEAAHGYVAKRCGDLTAYKLGRVSLNPLRHVDPIGTVIVPLVMLVGAAAAGAPGFLFGWAKPVPVNFHALRNPKVHMAIVAAAGPAANFVQAIVWGMLLKLLGESGGDYLVAVATAGVIVNLILMVINLLPILPLDGGRIALSLLPDRWANNYARLEPYGFPILLVVMIAHMQMGILDPLMNGAGQAFVQLLGLGA